LAAETVIEKVLHDIETAEQLLAEDPITEQGPHTTFENGPDDFYNSYRNRRMNYYAVKALEARVQLYAGNNQKALEAAETVINEAQNWFPWIEPSEVISENENPNRIFSTEVIFGVQNKEIYSRQKALFSGNLRELKILAPLEERLENRYENNINDYRYNPWWRIPTTGGKTYPTFFKYADVVDTEKKFRFFQPLIRISEMYYIAAETESNSSQAIGYLDTVRYHRGLNNLPVSANLKEEITKAYRKEFYGEGQLFFYYKRNNFSSIPDGSSPVFDVRMNASKYVVPLPNSEINN